MRKLRFYYLTILAVIWILIWAISAAGADSFCVDNDRSHFGIQVDTGGLFGAFGHAHVIAAKNIKGCADIDWMQLDRSSVDLTFATSAITVLDPKHPDDRPKVQETMEKDVLKVAGFPQVRFKSDRVTVKRTTAGSAKYELLVEGPLTIRDHTERVSIPLTVERNA